VKFKDTPLIQALLRYQGENYRPLHMPGHKQGNSQPDWFKELLGPQVFKFDLTELPGLDDLHNPVGVISEAQQAAARCFGAEESFFLVNGSTVGLQAMIMAAARTEAELLIPRQAHRSVLGGLILAGVRPRYLPVEIEKDFQIPLGTPNGAVEKVLREVQQVNGLLIVHPNYYGITSDLGGLVRVAKSSGLICLADEAHGPHFRFHEQLPITALEAGVDATTQSLHKVLSSLTQTALLHRQGQRLPAERLKKALNLLQSTSPSYILMASLEAACWQMENEGRELLERTLELAAEARQQINQIQGLRCLGEEVKKYHSVSEWDQTKLIINVHGLGLTGVQAAHILREDYGIQVEMADSANILAMVTIGDRPEAVQDLVRACRELAVRWYGQLGWPKQTKPALYLDTDPEVVLTPREAFFWSQRRTLRLREAEGEIAGETICPYPPGIPLLAPGERITRPVIETIEEWRTMGITWQGPTDPTLTTIQVLEV
jgi:arginine decarboxylase